MEDAPLDVESLTGLGLPEMPPYLIISGECSVLPGPGPLSTSHHITHSS